LQWANNSLTFAMINIVLLSGAKASSEERFDAATNTNVVSQKIAPLTNVRASYNSYNAQLSFKQLQIQEPSVVTADTAAVSMLA
jgi:hypothetical protein